MFFSGHISCYRENEDDYLVDGNAINGVSGGPAFYVDSKTSETKICGVVTAYIPNRATGEALPGLCVVTSVEPYQEDLKKLRSIDDAKKKAEEEKKEQQIETEKKTEPGKN